MSVNGMTASRYLATFETEVLSWQMKLGNMSENTVKMQEI